MFARRRTDQVFATLQQVQRRITEQGGGHVAAAVTPAGVPLPQRPQTAMRQTAVPSRSEAEQAAIAPPVLPPGVGAHQRYRVELSGAMVSLLVVCWLLSLAFAVIITVWVMRAPATPASSPASVAASGPAGGAASSPRWKLVVASERASAEARQRFLAERAFLNQVAERNGWPPLFDIEEGANGHLLLVFGRQGLDKAEWVDFTAKLSRRHPGATWVELR